MPRCSGGVSTHLLADGGGEHGVVRAVAALQPEGHANLGARHLGRFRASSTSRLLDSYSTARHYSTARQLDRQNSTELDRTRVLDAQAHGVSLDKPRQPLDKPRQAQQELDRHEGLNASTAPRQPHSSTAPQQRPRAQRIDGASTARPDSSTARQPGLKLLHACHLSSRNQSIDQSTTQRVSPLSVLDSTVRCVVRSTAVVGQPLAWRVLITRRVTYSGGGVQSFHSNCFTGTTIFLHTSKSCEIGTLVRNSHGTPTRKLGQISTSSCPSTSRSDMASTAIRTI